MDGLPPEPPDENTFRVDGESKTHNKSKLTQFNLGNDPTGLLSDEHLLHLTRGKKFGRLRHQSDTTCFHVTDSFGDEFKACRTQHLFSGWGPRKILITEGGGEQDYFDSKAIMRWGMHPNANCSKGQFGRTECEMPGLIPKRKFPDINPWKE